MTRRMKHILMAWMMVFTFITALLVKDIHAHIYADSQLASTEQCQTTVKAQCYICNFDICKMSMPHLFVWQPVLVVKRLVQPLFIEQVVYHQPIKINTHSPPFYS